MQGIIEGDREQEGQVDTGALVDQYAHSALEAGALLHKGTADGGLWRQHRRRVHKYMPTLQVVSGKEELQVTIVLSKWPCALGKSRRSGGLYRSCLVQKNK